MTPMRRPVVLGCTLLAVVAAAAVAAASTAAKTAASSPIVIGYSADLVGQMSPFDTPALTAAQLEVKKINAQGGVLGRKLEIKVCNTQNSKPDVAKSCAANLISQGASVAFVTCDVDFATPAAQEFLNKGLL